MFTRKLGRSGIDVSALGFGCWAMGGPYTSPQGKQVGWGDIDDKQSIAAIHRAMDLGVNFFDTAACYGAGHSEHVVGEALAGRRQRAVIATKFWHVFDEDARRVLGSGEKPEDLRQMVEGCGPTTSTCTSSTRAASRQNAPRRSATSARSSSRRARSAGTAGAPTIRRGRLCSRRAPTAPPSSSD